MSTNQSFRALVAEVISKYPQYQSVLNSIKTEHEEAKKTLHTAKQYTDEIDGKHKEYLTTINGIMQTTQTARDEALRHLDDVRSLHQTTQNIKDDTQGYKNETQRLYNSVKDAIDKINAISLDYQKLNLEQLLKDIIAQDSQINKLFSKVIDLLVLEPKYQELRDEIIKHQQTILKDIQIQAKIAQEAYSDTRRLLYQEKSTLLELRDQVKSTLQYTQALSVDTQKEILTLREHTLSSIRELNYEALKAIDAKINQAFKEFDALKEKSITEIQASKQGLDALLEKAKDILKESQAIKDITQNFAFALRVRQFMAVYHLMALSSTSNHIISLMTKARLEYVEFEAHESKLATFKHLQEIKELDQNLRAFIEQNQIHFMKELLNFKSDLKNECDGFKQGFFNDAQTFIDEAKKDFKAHKESFFEKADEFNKQTHESILKLQEEHKKELVTIVDDARSIKNTMENVLKQSTQEMQNNLTEAKQIKLFVQEKAQALSLLAYLK